MSITETSPDADDALTPAAPSLMLESTTALPSISLITCPDPADPAAVLVALPPTQAVLPSAGALELVCPLHQVATAFRMQHSISPDMPVEEALAGLEFVVESVGSGVVSHMTVSG